MKHFALITIALCSLAQGLASDACWSWNTYATHQPVLYAAARETSGPIVEFGCGEGSTRMLHEICKETGRTLISIDNNREWIEKYSLGYIGDGYEVDNSDWHKFVYVPEIPGNSEHENWVAFLENCPLLKEFTFDVVFVDQSPWSARTITIRKFQSSAKYVILHDCDAYGNKLGKKIRPLDRLSQTPGIYDFSPTFKVFKVFFPPKPWPGETGPPTLIGTNQCDSIPEVIFD